MQSINGFLLVVFTTACFVTANQETASAQYPVTVAPVAAPAAVGYTTARRGLFGRRVVYRSYYAPVAPVVPVTAALPVAASVTVARPVYASPVVTTRYAPIAVAPPVRAYYAPPVRAYYAPAVPVYRPIVPVARYRVPVYAPTFGY